MNTPKIIPSNRVYFFQYVFQLYMWSKQDTDLVTVLPKNILPAIYGGTEKSLEDLRSNSS